VRPLLVACAPGPKVIELTRIEMYQVKPPTPKDSDAVFASDLAHPSGFRSVEDFWYGSNVMREPPVAIGATIAEKYVVERVLGEGGMGIVLAARHRDLDQRVAIKCLLPEIAQRGVAAERFRREARAVAGMRSEHICRVLDVGTLADGIPFMIMEYLDGCDLAQELERRERLPYREAVAYVLQACDALSEAHHAGIIHRDLKPANLFLEQRGAGARRIKVLDFGVSKSLLEAQKSQALTQTANMVGSPLYMSPEQLESSRDVDARADIWGLGVVLYELIRGEPPFAASSIPQLIASVINQQPSKLPDQLDVPHELEAVIMRMLAKDRRERYSSIEEVSDQLAPYAATPTSAYRTTQLGAAERPRSAAPVGVGGARGLTTRTSQTPLSWDRNDKMSGSRKGLAIGAVVLALAVVGAAAAYVYQNRSGDDLGPGVAKPLPEQRPSPAAALTSTGEPVERDIPRGVLPEAAPAAEAPPQDPKAAGTVPEQAKEPAPSPASAAPASSLAPTPAAAAKAARPPSAPAPAVSAKPPSAPPAQTPNVRGAPPRGQISDFGGRR
jgi:serine/threonine-protein kinase